MFKYFYLSLLLFFTFIVVVSKRQQLCRGYVLYRVFTMIGFQITKRLHNILIGLHRQ